MTRRSSLWAVVPACVLFLLGALHDMGVPGLYMDAVNPDYMVTRLLTPSTVSVPYWVPPGTLLFGRLPVLGQIYHGALPLYAGLPAYALFGTGVEGVRIANAWFGLLVLGAAGFFLVACRVRPVFAGLVLAALALDPGFVFAWRTQFYITLLPLALVLLAAGLVEGMRPSRWMAIAAGACAGLSVWGYFIFLFLVPAAAVHAAVRWRRGLWAWWAVGLVVGAAPYLVGYALILADTGSVSGFLTYIRGNLAALGVEGAAAMPLSQRPGLFFGMVMQTLSDTGPSAMMLHEALPQRLFRWTLALTLVLPAAGLVASLVRRPRLPGLPLLAGYGAGLFLLVLVFGDRLWLHHLIMLLPILYCAAGLALEALAQWLLPTRRGLAVALAVLLVAPNLFARAEERQAVFARLEATGGVGRMSDAIDRFSEDTKAFTGKQKVYLPDWGVFMGFVMITDGQIPLETGFSPLAARYSLCGGEDAVLATFVDQPAERLAAWKAAVPVRSDSTIYRQRDGVPVLEVTRWKATPTACP